MKINALKIARLLAAGAFIVLTAGILSHVSAQSKLQQNIGRYHGELDFPISWKQYYTFEEKNKILQDLQRRYPQLADLESIGKSRMGRDQLLLTISTKSVGDPKKKPALWLDGAIHGNEVNGITCSLYLAWYLLTEYEYNQKIHDLVDNCTFYILPGLNVDANASFVSWPNTASNPREPYRPEDNDGDGLYDEDQTEDVDGDGELSTMYKVDSLGTFKLSPDGRRFITVTDPNEKVLKFIRIGSEGYDNDGDGRINEDDIGGPDPNRNFPYDWNLRDGWPYPLSEPETRNAFEAQLKRKNIFATLHFHNTGKLIMFAAPPAVTPPAGVPVVQLTPEQRRQRQAEADTLLAQMRRENKYAQYFDRQIDPQYKGDWDSQMRIVTMGARILKDYRPTSSGLVGQHQTASYYCLGAFAYLNELWGTPTEINIDSESRISDEEMLMWMDIELNGEGWITPHKAIHKDLGEVWIGGSAQKFIGRTPVLRYIEEEALRNTQFAMYIASQFPKVEIGDVKVTPAGSGNYYVDVTVMNNKDYPTFSDRSLALRRAVMDKLQFVSSGTVVLGTGTGGENIEVVTVKEKDFRLLGRQQLQFRFPVTMTGTSGWVEISVVSQFGGTAKKRADIRAGGR